MTERYASVLIREADALRQLREPRFSKGEVRARMGRARLRGGSADVEDDLATALAIARRIGARPLEEVDFPLSLPGTASTVLRTRTPSTPCCVPR